MPLAFVSKGALLTRTDAESTAGHTTSPPSAETPLIFALLSFHLYTHSEHHERR